MWDDHLSYLLTPALAAYKTERVTGWFEKKIIHFPSIITSSSSSLFYAFRWFYGLFTLPDTDSEPNPGMDILPKNAYSRNWGSESG